MKLGMHTVLIAAALGAQGCDQVKGTIDRAVTNLSSLKTSCPEPVEGRVAGADSADQAFGCFQKAAKEGSADLLQRVSCASRAPASCKHTPVSKTAVEQLASDLKKHDWSGRIGRWEEGKDGKVVDFSVDTYPTEKRVSVVTVCRIAEGDKWAICELGEMSREQAEQKAK